MKRVVYRAVLIVISLVGITNIVDSIIASNIADASTSGLTMSATINPSSTITINADSVNLDITPSASGTLKSSDALTVSAYTNTNYDCNVTMTASSSSLVSGANSIPSLATGTTYTDATFTNDSWGYKIGTGNYNPVLTGEGANAIKTISSMTGGTANTTDIFFAAKLTPATKPGTYTNTVTFASTCTPPPRTYMQDVNEATLATLMPNVGDTTTLYDARDENEYAVTKLADGYYWMTQNLRLGRGNGEIIALNSTNSDLPSGTTFNLKASGMGSNQPDATGDCNVGNWYPFDDEETETNTSHLCINTSDTETYGVYYNWYTATAGTGTYSVTSGEAAGSICPKGWILPPISGERSYYNLLFTKGGLSNNAASATAMQTTPYNFPLSGDSYGEGIYGVGSRGYFWSSTAYDSQTAYRMDFRSSNVYPDYEYFKSLGHSVRCVFGS